MLTAGEAAELVGGVLTGDPSTPIAGTAPLDRAGPGDCAFVADRRYLEQYRVTAAGVVIVDGALADAPTACGTTIVAGSARRAFEIVQRAVAPVGPSIPWGIHPSASLGPGVRWTGRIALGPHVVVGAGVTFGTDCVLHQGAAVGDGARLGDGCRLERYATVLPSAILGDRVRLRPGASVGGAGFGFHAGERDVPERRAHAGRCILGSDVEVGTHATVDRGRVGDTVIGDGTKLDAHVHIAHNVRVGKGCLIMAQVGVAGSSEIGDAALLGGQAGITDHVRIGRRARVAAQAGVIGDVADDAQVSGYPARDHRQVLRQAAALGRLTPLVSPLERLVSTDD